MGGAVNSATAPPVAPAIAGRPNTSVEAAFVKLVGRQPSGQERDRLYRLRDALQLEDNDAFWSIVMALDYYDSFFRQYPAQLAAVTERALERARAACAAAAQHEVAAVQRQLSEKVAETSVALARKLAERPVGVHRFTAAMAAVVAFGALCMQVGYGLAQEPRPFWVAPSRERGVLGTLAVMLSIPAGWMIFALLVPLAAYGGKLGWALAADGMAERRERAVGWGLVLLCVAGLVACAAMLARLT
jgi:hypothetical protein